MLNFKFKFIHSIKFLYLVISIPSYYFTSQRLSVIMTLKIQTVANFNNFSLYFLILSVPFPTHRYQLRGTAEAARALALQLPFLPMNGGNYGSCGFAGQCPCVC